MSFKPPTGWYFVMAPLAKQYSSSCVNGHLPQSLGLGLTLPHPRPHQSSQTPPRGWWLNSTYDCGLVVCIYFSEASSQDLGQSWLLDLLLRCCCGPCLPNHPSFGKTHLLPFLVFQVGPSVIAIYLPFLHGTTCPVHSLHHYSRPRNISEG